MFVSRLPPVAVACALIALGLSPARAAATYGVGTSAQAWDHTAFVNVVSAYRMGQNASGTFSEPSDTPPYQINGCSFIPANPDFVCEGSWTGTASTSYNLTASSSTASLGTARLSQPAYAGQSVGSTYADLATGKLGGTSQADWARGATTYASFSDRLTFNIDGAGPATVTTIRVSFAIDGGFTLLNSSRASAQVNGDLRFGVAFATLNDGNAVVPSQIQGGWVTGGWVSDSPGTSVFTGTYALVGAAPTLDLRTRLMTNADWGALASYSNTAAFQMSLPANVSYTSDSGVFLSAVPEPGTWALMLAGLAGTGWVARRRRQQR